MEMIINTKKMDFNKFNHLHLTLGLDFTLKSFLLPPGIPCQEAEERERWTIPLSV